MRQRAYVKISLKQTESLGRGVALVADGKAKLYRYIKLSTS